jgi:hypothetical protein
VALQQFRELIATAVVGDVVDDEGEHGRGDGEMGSGEWVRWGVGEVRGWGDGG